MIPVGHYIAYDKVSISIVFFRHSLVISFIRIVLHNSSISITIYQE